MTIYDHITYSAMVAASWALDQKVLLAVTVSLISGFFRGFSGFGSALVFVPLMGALYNPQIAAVTLVVIDLLGSVFQTRKQFKLCQWADLRLISIGALPGVFGGVLSLQYWSADHLRDLTFAVVLLAAFLVMRGWSYQGEPNRILTVGVGFVSGFLGGSVAMEGPPVTLFWLSGSGGKSVVYANVMVFIFLTELFVLFFYMYFGLVLVLNPGAVIILGTIFWIGFFIGNKYFQTTTNRTYKAVACALMILAAALSLRF